MRLLVVTSIAVGSVVVTAAAGCSPEFAPASLITAPRIVAVVAEPPEAVPGTVVTLTPTIASPDGTLVEGEGYDATWWRCPDGDSDALGDFDQCTVPSERRDIGSGDPYVDVVPLDLFGELPTAPPAPGEVPAVATGDKVLGALLGYWRVVGLTMDAADGGRIDGFKREPVYLPFPLGQVDERLADLDVRVDGDGAIVPNTNPLLTAVLVHEGAVDGPTVTSIEQGETYFFEPRIDDRSLQVYGSLKVDLKGIDVTDPESLKALDVDALLSRFTREARCEVPVFNWYVTAGALRREITLDESVITRVFDEQGVACPPVEGDVRAPEAEFTAPTGEEGDPVPDDGVVHGWVVVRDGRGGTAVRSFDLPID
jgi:hypothetical protein